MNAKEINAPLTVEERIQTYLSNGGLINPELMDPHIVRDLILDCRDELKRLKRLKR